MLRPSHSLVRAVLIFTFTAASAVAGEYAVLGTGFRIHAESHVIDGEKVRLQTEKGVIELPCASVARFEQEEYTAPVAAVQPTVQAAFKPVAQSAPIPVLTPKQMVSEAARVAGLPPGLVHSLVRAESAYRVNALSPKGAIGLMQLMPGTAASLNANPYDPKQNVEAGVAYLKDLLIKYQSDDHQVTKAIAAYNAGPGAVDKYHGIPPYRETMQYVDRVVRQYLKNPDAQ